MSNDTSPVCYGMYKQLLIKNTLSFQISAVFLVSFSIPAAIATTFGNILILYTLYVTPSLHTAGNVHIVALAISDAFVGLFVLPINAVLRALSIYNVHVCWLKMSYILSIAAGTGISLLTATTIAIDRFIAVVFTKVYRKWLLQTKYKFVLLCLWFAWMLFLCLVAAKIVPSKGFYVGLMIIIVVCILVVLVCYALILIKIRKENNTIADLVPGNIIITEAKKKERKRLVTIGIIIFFFFISYLPKCFCTLLSELNKKSADIDYQCGRWSDLFLLLNSAVNPFIYCKRIENIRTEVVKNLRKLFRKRAQVEPEA